MKRGQRAAILVLLAIVVFAPIVSAGAWFGFVYWSGDEIDRAGLEAHFVFKKYEIFQNPEDVTGFIFERRGEAANHQILIDFAAWGIEHPEDFVEIIESINQEHKKEVSERLAFAVYDGGQSEEFKNAFDKYSASESVRNIFSELQTLYSK